MTYRVVTVFGGSGFIGRSVVRELAARGWRVNVATRHPDKALFLKPMGAVGQIAPIFANIRDDLSVVNAIRGADTVINLVGLLHESGRQTFRAAHKQGAGRIAAAARELGVGSLVQMSAIGASDTSPSTYAQTKAGGEKAVRTAFPDASILRPSIVFGPDDSFFNRFAGQARFKVLPLIGGGRTRFQPVYVGDVADAVMACLDQPEAKGRIYELGGPKIYTFRELMELTLSMTDRRALLMPIPWFLAQVMGAFFGLMPKPMLTRDQVRQLRIDNVVASDAPGLADLGIAPTAAEVILPTYLARFRPRGQFARQGARI